MHAGQFCLEYVLWICMCVCLLMITGCYYSTNKKVSRGALRHRKQSYQVQEQGLPEHVIGLLPAAAATVQPRGPFIHPFPRWSLLCLTLLSRWQYTTKWSISTHECSGAPSPRQRCPERDAARDVGWRERIWIRRHLLTIHYNYPSKKERKSQWETNYLSSFLPKPLYSYYLLSAVALSAPRTQLLFDRGWNKDRKKVLITSLVIYLCTVLWRLFTAKSAHNIGTGMVSCVPRNGHL